MNGILAASANALVLGALLKVKSRQQATKVLRLRAVPLIVAQIALVFWVAAMPGVILFADSAAEQTQAGLDEAIAAQAIRPGPADERVPDLGR